MKNQLTVTLVVIFLGMFALGGLAGLVFLLWDGADAATVAVVATPMGVALGALGAVLASTSVNPPAPVVAEPPPGG